MSNQNERDKALRRALNILAYADNTEAKLRRKLADRDFSPDAINYAVGYVIEKGYLNERRQLENALRTLAETKLMGRRRILLELAARGYKREIIDEVQFDDIDFPQNCARLLEKRIGAHTTAEYDAKTAAYLRGRGYSQDDIRAAYRILNEKIDGENNNGDE